MIFTSGPPNTTYLSLLYKIITIYSRQIYQELKEKWLYTSHFSQCKGNSSNSRLIFIIQLISTDNTNSTLLFVSIPLRIDRDMSILVQVMFVSVISRSTMADNG